MSNVTLSIDDEVLKRARIRALQQGTSVNAVVRSFLESYAGCANERRSLRLFLEASDRYGTGADDSVRTWKREELYEDRARWPRS
ncbi:MAG: hypothetical protein GEU78_17660 [Actinobacteria bacterium]|nr:hypothetical protein [Actinomycetota bacterium]